MFCQKCGAINKGDAQVCVKCGADLPKEGSSVNNAFPKMKWFKFLANFWLFLYAIGLVFWAYIVLSGSIYGNQIQQIYHSYPGLLLLDKSYGIAQLALAVFAIYISFSLRQYRKNAPRFLFIFFASTICLDILALAICAIMFSSTYISFDVAYSGSALPSEILNLVFNTIYFKKRKHLFVN